MANKLTSKKLQELIMEVLNEETLSLARIRDNTKSNQKGTLGKINDALKDLAKRDGSGRSISKEDIVQAIEAQSVSEIELIKFLTSDNKKTAALKASVREEFKKLLDSALEDLRKKYGGDKFTLKTGDSLISKKDQSQTVFPFDLSNASMQDSTPRLSPSLKNLFDVLALHEDTFQGRIKKISEFSQNLASASDNDDDAVKKLRTMGPLRFTQYALVLDYLASIAKQVDAGSGAYMFETFLAALAGGYVTGKETTVSGQMGGADFTFGKDGVRGSSKYLKPGSDASQAASGFEKEEYVHYVIARKILETKTGSRKTDDVSSTDVDQVIGFQINYPILQVVEPKSVFQFIELKNGKPTPYKTIDLFRAAKTGDITKAKGGAVDRIKIPTTINSLGVLQIATINGERYRDLLSDAIEYIGGDIKQVFVQFQTAFDKVNSAKESVGSYSISGKQQDGNKAIQDLLAYKDALKLVFEKLKDVGFSKASAANKQATGYEAPDEEEINKLSENKKNQTKSLKDLDKLIERVIIESMNKK